MVRQQCHPPPIAQTCGSTRAGRPNLECLYVEYHYGNVDALKYTNGYRKKVLNRRPIIGERGSAARSDKDRYLKGALFLNTPAQRRR